MLNFTAKEFREKLKSPEILLALRGFAKTFYGKQNNEYILEYFKCGGSCIELVQVLETGTGKVQLMLVFEIIYNVTLTVVSSFPQYISDVNEGCRYLLNTHAATINKMLGVSANFKERKIMLKLLTIIVTLSTALAKNVMQNVKFNAVNLDYLSAYTEDDDSVRNAFINFLLAFLIDGNYPTISVLLDRKEMLASIIKDLQFDKIEVLCRVLLLLKNHVLENPNVSKTVKMNIFSTPIVKDIVNLYNWKGPKGYDPKKRDKRKDVEVDEQEKLQVNECVHEFLLILCTSNKFGVIFRDKTLGLSKTPHNNLMYTVITGLERPWEHSYARELVIKICGACPDLVKKLWENLKEFLEPKPSVQWLNGVKFCKSLLNELKPSVVEHVIKDFSVSQLSSFIQVATLPTDVIKTLIPEENALDDPVTKVHILSLLSDFLNLANLYVEAATNWLTETKLGELKNELNNYISSNFPNVQTILRNWDKLHEANPPEGFETHSILNNLNVIFDLLQFYKKLCSPLIEDLSKNSNLMEFVKYVETVVPSDEHDQIATLTVKIVNLYLDYNVQLFLPDSSFFSDVVPKLLKSYFTTKDLDARHALVKVLKLTNIFENCEAEINVWINGVFDLKTVDNFASFLVEIVQLTYKNLAEYKKKLLDFEEGHDSMSMDTSTLDDSAILNENNECVNPALSPLIIGMLNSLESNKHKYVNTYVNFVLPNLLHLQGSSVVLNNVLSSNDYCEHVPSGVYNYINSWLSGNEITALAKTKGKIFVFSNFSRAFLEGNFGSFLKENESNLNDYPDLKLDLLQMMVFYTGNFAINDLYNEKHQRFSQELTTYIIENVDDKNNILNVLLQYPILLQTFSPAKLSDNSSRGFCTKFIVNAIETLKKSNCSGLLDNCLKSYRSKLFSQLKKAIKKLKKGENTFKNDNLLNVITILDLDYEQSTQALRLIIKLNRNILVSPGLVVYKILLYVLRHITQICSGPSSQTPLDEDIILNISETLTFLNEQAGTFDTSTLAETLNNYLNKFPQMIANLNENLFKSILLKPEYCKENASLATLLLKNNVRLLEVFQQNVATVANRKGFMLPLIDCCLNLNASTETLKKIYECFEPSIVKALQKPQKAGQHFEKHFKGTAALINNFMPESAYKTYLEKIQKFETTEIFHVTFLDTIFNKGILAQENLNEKHINNAILTFVHLGIGMFKKVTKMDDDWVKVEKCSRIFCKFLEKVLQHPKNKEISLGQVCENESFKLYCKFCLKYGISEKKVLLKLLTLFVGSFDFKDDDASLLLEMAVSHSEFLDVVLSDEHSCKYDLIALFSQLCTKWPHLMARNHIPVLLAAYNATLEPCDRIIYLLLKRYAAAPGQTGFYDFKPFLWGRSAATHYSIRSLNKSVLWRQPRMGDVMDILREDWVLNTIKYYPLNLSYEEGDYCTHKTTYDLRFLYQVFNLLLAQENVVQTHKFTMSGALSLTIAGLSCESETIRASSLSILRRFYNHVEAKIKGKDNLLYLTLLNTLRAGLGALGKWKLNNFASVFFSRMALILTQPQHLLYTPLSQYLVAKKNPDLSGIPELYTFLHSADVNYSKYRSFILNVLRDGMRTEQDFHVAAHSMSFKLLMELFNSITDVGTKVQILSVFKNATRIPLGAKLLLKNYAFLSYIYMALGSSSNEELNVHFIEILKNIVQNVQETKILNAPIIRLMLSLIINKQGSSSKEKQAAEDLLRTLNIGQ